MGIVRDGNCPVGIVRDGNCPRWELSTWWELFGWELSGMGTVRDGNYPDTVFSPSPLRLLQMCVCVCVCVCVHACAWIGVYVYVCVLQRVPYSGELARGRGGEKVELFQRLINGGDGRN